MQLPPRRNGFPGFGFGSNFQQKLYVLPWEGGGGWGWKSCSLVLEFALHIGLKTSLSRTWVKLVRSIKAGQSDRSECQKEKFMYLWIF